jgi:phage terminase small subunit
MTPRQIIFTREYLIDLNATQAALRAGYKLGYARRACFTLLRKPGVAAAIRDGMAARARRTEIDADRVMREYAKLAFVDIRRLVKRGADGGVELRDLWEMSEEDAAAITHLWRTGRGRGLRIKLHDKRAALDALARHLGLFGKVAGPGVEAPVAGGRLRDFRTPAQDRARAALRQQIARVIAARGEKPEGGDKG